MAQLKTYASASNRGEGNNSHNSQEKDSDDSHGGFGPFGRSIHSLAESKMDWQIEPEAVNGQRAPGHYRADLANISVF